MTNQWWDPPADTTIDLSVVVPTYNEAGRLQRTLTDAEDYLRGRDMTFEVIIADDGSTDDTVDFVKRHSVHNAEVSVLGTDRNRGKGHAVRRGMLAARGRLIIFIDADGATPFREFARLEAALETGAGIAIGSRSLSEPGVTRDTRLHRRVMGRLFSAIVSLAVLADVGDTQCGFKLFTRPAAREIFGRATRDGFSFDVEILSIARRLHVPVVEVAVSWTDVPRSRVRLVRDSLAMLRDVMGIRRAANAGSYDGPIAP